jgi:hypothetical protein
LNIRIFIVLLFLAFFQAQCSKDKTFPDIPEISLSEEQELNSPQQIIIEFTDGDGDVGFNDGDTLPPNNFVRDTINDTEGSLNLNYYNILLFTFAHIDGNWEEIFPINPFHGRIPYLTPSGQNKALRGTISIDVNLSDSPFDSLRFEIELRDRALNSSNRIQTPTIFI